MTYDSKTTLGVILACLAGLFFVRSFSTPGQLPQEAHARLMESSSGQCLNKEQCLLVYVTPWCPACKSSGSFLSELQSFLAGSKTGVIIAVGQDDPDKIENMAKSLGGNVIRDRGGEISSSFRVGAVPHWVVWDKDLHILAKRGSGTPSGGSSAEARVEYFLRERLGLESW